MAAFVVQRLASPAGAATTRSRVFGGALVAAGLTTSVLAARSFQRAGTTLDPGRPEEARVLVTTGLHGVSRNPMYLGLIGVLLGHAVWRRSSWALVPAVAAWAWLDRVQVPAEEQAMQDRHGVDYQAYLRRVPRWLGPVVDGD